ncbi:MAG TPA: hypothetical protein VFS31_15560, partial [Chitinophagaceae bacterium]|nr:hypothetical protein [Chitinophagaceae bacterium]
MKKIILALFLLNGMALSLRAQQSGDGKSSDRKEKREARREKINMLSRQEEEGEVVFNKQSIFGFKLATDGYGLSYEWGKFKDSRKNLLLQFELNEKKHPKEKKETYTNPSGFGFTNVIY